MIIGIDGNEANVENRVGVNEYAYEVLWGIYELRQEWQKENRVIVFLKNPPNKSLPPEDDFFQYKVLPAKGLWILSRFTPYLFLTRQKPDVVLCLSHYVPPISPMARIVSIMDLGYLRFSGQFKKYDFWQLKLWTAWSIRVSKRIIAISQSTKDDIVRHYPFAKEKTEVVYLASDPQKFHLNMSSSAITEVIEKYSIVKPYVLFISTLKPSKNIEGLLDAWKTVSDNIKSYQLVIAGKKGWLYDTIFKKVKKLGLEKEVVFTDFVKEDEKPALISGAKALVLPSFWEGFGLDPLNAMMSGVPVVVSNVGSLPEVVGEAGILIDPYKKDSLVKGIMKVLSLTKKEYNRMVEKGLRQSKKFSWEKSAREILKIVKNLNK